MTFDEANEKTRDYVATFFGDGHVFYANVKMAKYPEPYLTTRFLSFTRPDQAIKEIDEEGWEHSYREIVGKVDLNLYTKGREVRRNSGVYYNTALNDMQEFLNYLDSDEGQFEMMRNNMTILPTGNVQDLSALQNDSAFQFRSMVELEVHFIDDSFGDYGQNNSRTLPNNSEGGSEDFIDMEPDLIESVDINHTKENK